MLKSKCYTALGNTTEAESSQTMYNELMPEKKVRLTIDESDEKTENEKQVTTDNNTKTGDGQDQGE